MAQKYVFPSPERNEGMKPGGFGKFKLDVAKLLAHREVMELATYLSFPNADFDRLVHSEFPGLTLVTYLESQGVITPTDISQLIYVLKECSLDGIAENALHSYKRNVSSNSGTHGDKSTTPREDITKARKLCADIVYIGSTSSRPSQESTIKLLNVASLHKISIPHLRLQWSFRRVESNAIRLESGLCLQSLSTLQKISINGGGKQELTEEEVIELINFGLKSPNFMELWLHGCKLPVSIKKSIIPDESKRRNIKVISSNEARCLNLGSGKWKTPEDIQAIKQMCSDGLSINKNISTSAQGDVINLLVKASNRDIPIDQVNLNGSFSKVDENGNIILGSGFHLPILTSLKTMGIQTERGREIDQKEINGILNYVQQSKIFKELDLRDCLLTSISMGSALSSLKSRDIKVYWTPDTNNANIYYRLNRMTGFWAVPS